MSRGLLPICLQCVQIAATNYKHKICALFLCLLSANAQLVVAAAIVIEPIYTYVNGNNKASSISSIISTHNAAAGIRGKAGNIGFKL